MDLKLILSAIAGLVMAGQAQAQVVVIGGNTVPLVLGSTISLNTANGPVTVSCGLEDYRRRFPRCNLVRAGSNGAYNSFTRYDVYIVQDTSAGYRSNLAAGGESNPLDFRTAMSQIRQFQAQGLCAGGLQDQCSVETVTNNDPSAPRAETHFEVVAYRDGADGVRKYTKYSSASFDDAVNVLGQFQQSGLCLDPNRTPSPPPSSMYPVLNGIVVPSAGVTPAQ